MTATGYPEPCWTPLGSLGKYLDPQGSLFSLDGGPQSFGPLFQNTRPHRESSRWALIGPAPHLLLLMASSSWWPPILVSLGGRDGDSPCPG